MRRCLTLLVVPLALTACGSTDSPADAVTTTRAEQQPEAEGTAEDSAETLDSETAADSDNATPADTVEAPAEAEEPASAEPEPTETQTDDPVPLIVTHPIAELDAMWASQPFATRDNGIGIQFHNGVDYFVTEPQVTVLSAISGTFQDAKVMERQPDGAFQVNLMIISDGGQVVSYSLEPSAGPADEAKIVEQAILSQQMLDAMTAKPGDRVDIGQPIGILLGQDEWAHVHMTVKQSNSQPEIWLCPMEYMSPDELDDLAEPTQAWADRLYQGAKTPELCNT